MRSYSNVVSTIALVFAMSGTALAADHYLITSTSQIKPSVLKQLHGAQGRAGTAGPQGPAGAAGAPGANGTPGAQGLAGLPGAPGTMGLQGAEGPEGAPGAEGPEGVEGPEGPEGPPGEQGAEGNQGPEGKEGKAGPASVERVDGPAEAAAEGAADGTTVTSQVSCPAGKTLTGGGASVQGSSEESGALLSSQPSKTGSQLEGTWSATAIVMKSGSGRVSVTAYALCAG